MSGDGCGAMPEQAKQKAARNRDSISNTLLVAIGVSLFCSVLVSAAAVILKPLQVRNEDLYRQRIVLEVAGLYEPGADVDALFANIETRLVDLSSGDYVSELDAKSFDAQAASKDATLGVDVPPSLDIAGVHRRAAYAQVFLVRQGTEVEQIILPVYGYGLWSVMYGYLALQPDGRTVRGLRFYDHGETPGLGDQIDKADWLAGWPGISLFDASGQPRVEVVKGQVIENSAARFQVDGLAGATLTGRGVQNLLRYWVGAHGFGPYLSKIAQEADDDG
jgi:Na+-transporting NADH:ubiquinone oxidoreductase subunit C